MSYLSELTAHERLTVDNATLDMFTAFENGSDLIYDIWEQYFSDRERKNIESRDLEFIGRILYSVYDRMANAIRDYHLMLGHYDAPGVQCFLDTAKRAQLTIDAVKASEHARNEMRTAAYWPALASAEFSASRSLRSCSVLAINSPAATFALSSFTVMLSMLAVVSS